MKNEKRVVLIGAMLIILVAVFTFVRPMIDWGGASSEKENSTKNDSEQYSFISATDLEKQFDQVVIFDSRPSDQFNTEHLIGSFNVSQDSLDQYLPKALNQKIIIVGTDSNDLSAKLLAQKLEEGGVGNFSVLSGGLASWIESGDRTVRLGNPNSLSDQAKINIIKPEDLKSVLDSQNPKIYILDLRSPSQFSSEHLPQAQNIPASQLEEKRKSIPLGRSLVYYAGSELEAFQLGVALFDLGFPGASALEGGLDAWKAKGFPVEK